MANIKITMLELRKMVQYFDLNLSQRSISTKMRISRTSVSVYKQRADSLAIPVICTHPKSRYASIL